jgi:hypothetical protein
MAISNISSLGDLTRLGNHSVGNLAIELAEHRKLVIEAEDNLMEYSGTEVCSGSPRVDTRNGVPLIAGMTTSV